MWAAGLIRAEVRRHHPSVSNLVSNATPVPIVARVSATRHRSPVHHPSINARLQAAPVNQPRNVVRSPAHQENAARRPASLTTKVVPAPPAVAVETATPVSVMRSTRAVAQLVTLAQTIRNVVQASAVVVPANWGHLFAFKAGMSAVKAEPAVRVIARWAREPSGFAPRHPAAPLIALMGSTGRYVAHAMVAAVACARPMRPLVSTCASLPAVAG
jgi:hypothetical protein